MRAGEARIAYIDPRDVAAAAAVLLTTNGHEGKAYSLTGPEAITFERIATELSAATGRHVQYVDVPDEAARQAMVKAGLPPMVAATIVDVFGSYRAGAMAHTTDTLRALIGRKPGSFARFARDPATTFGAGAAAPVGAAARV